MESQRLLRNALQTPDGTIIESCNIHDFNCYTDKNGKMYCVDGGLEYSRRIGDVEDCKDLSIYDNGDHSLRIKYLKWGTNYDKDMNKLPNTIYQTIENMDTGHIQAILNGNYCKSKYYSDIFKQELINREKINDQRTV